MPKFTTSDGLKLHYTDEGSGPPILCLSGLTRTGGDFNYLAPHLADTRLIRLDYRGRGGSDWGDPSTYTIPVEARDVVELLDHLNLATVPIIGTSRGGLIAMVLAATAKDRISGACLVDIGPKLETAGLDAIADYLGRRPAHRDFAAAAQARGRVMAGFANVPMSRWEEEVRLHFRETPDGLDITYDPKLRDAVLGARELPPPDLWPFFDALTPLPLALIRGANSDILSFETASEMARRAPAMVWGEVPDRGHVPFLDEPESLATITAWRALL